MNVIASRNVYWFFELLLLTGCTFHLTKIVIEYMNYPTQVNAALMIPASLNYPRVSLCFDLIPVLSNRSSIGFFNHLVSSEQFTISMTMQVPFDNTPAEDMIISSCLYRDTATHDVISLSNSSDCLQYFNIKKYIMQSYVCYRLTPINDTLYSFQQVAGSMEKRRLLYQVTVGYPFNIGIRTLPILHYSEYPFSERAFAKDILPSNNRSEVFELSMDLFWCSRLRAPYDTKCVKQGRRVCFYRCLDAEYAKMGSVGRSSVVSGPSNLTRSRTADERDATLYKSASHRCRDKCPNSACEERVPITFVSEPAVFQEPLSFIVETISAPIHRIVHTIKITFQSFLTTLASIMSIWFGASVLGTSNLRGRFHRYRSHIETGRHLSHQMLRVTYLYYKIMRTIQQLELNSNCTKNQLVEGVRMGDKYPYKWKIFLRLLYLAYQLTIVLLFSYEILLLFLQYFKYETRLSIKYNLSPQVALPNLVICVDLDQLLFSSNGTKYAEDDYDSILRRGNEKARAKEDVLTLKRIFDRALAAEEVVDACRYRNELDYLTLYKKEQCGELFNVSRFYFDWHMCYRISPIDRTRLLRPQMLRRNVGSLFSIITNALFKKFHYLLFIVYYGEYPYLSGKFLDQAYREDKDRLHTLSYAMHLIHLLPSPYDTRCVNMESHSAGCLSHCMLENGIRLNRLPVNEILPPMQVDLPIISYTDLSNDTLAKVWREIEISCENNCSRSPCRDDFTNTYISYAYPSTYPLEFSVNIPTIPPITSQAEARVSLYEFSYQSLCCLSFWLGITISTLNIEKVYSYKQLQLLDRIRRTVLRSYRLLQQVTSLVSMRNGRAFDSSQMREQFQSFISTKGRAETSGLRKFIRLSFYITCMIGFCHHSYISATLYFKYPTVMNTRAREETNFTPYSISVCLSLLDLLNHNDNASDASLSPHKRYTKPDLYTLSIGEMIDLTPNFTSMIKSCGYRVPRSKPEHMGKWTAMFADRMFVYESDSLKCSQVFNVSKYIMQEFICYNVKVNFTPSTSRTLNEPRMIYAVSLDPRTSSGKMVSYLVHKYPSESSIWSSTTHWSTRFNIPHYVMTYSRFRFLTLPLPHDTSQFNSHRQERCRRECFRKLLSAYNKIPSDQLVEPSVSQSRLCLVNLANNSHSVVKMLLGDMKSQCDAGCLAGEQMDDANDFEEIVTTLKTSAGSQRDTINIFSKMTNSPVIIVTFLPLITPVEFYLLMGNVFATWSGISMIHLNPFSLLLRHQSSSSRQLASQVDLAIQWLFMQHYSLQRTQVTTANASPII